MAETTTQEKAPKNGVAQSNGAPHNNQDAQTPATAHEEAAPEATTPTAPQGKSSKSARGKVIAAIVAAALLVVGGTWGSKALAWSRSHVSTDDAYVTSDVVQITPQVAGQLVRVLVDDNQYVKRGQLLATIDDATFRAQLAQEQANLAVALAAERSAQVGVGLTGANGQAQIEQASGGVDQARNGVAAAQADANRARNGIAAAQAATQNAQSQIATAQAAVAQAIATRNRVSRTAQASQVAISSALSGYKQAQGAQRAAIAGITAAQAAQRRAVAAREATRAQVATAQAGVTTAQDAATAARTQADRANRDEQRYEELFQGGAVSQQTVETARATATSARAQYDAARQQVSQAQTLVQQRQQELQGAQEQVNAAAAAVAQARAQAAQATAGLGAASAAIRQARAQYAASQGAISEAQAAIVQNQTKVVGARDQARQARIGIAQAQAQYQTSLRNIGVAQGKTTQALGQLRQAETAPQQLSQSQTSVQTAHAKVLQAQAAVQNALIALRHTRIVAPVDGVVSRRTGQEGQQVAAGQAIMSLIPYNDLWVVANLKETQLRTVRPGEKVEVEIDSLPGHTFRGSVQSLSAGTGATFALLPPDNATGNFTKVVQRVPVKIVLDSRQSGYDQLRAGLSANVTIDTA